MNKEKIDRYIDQCLSAHSLDQDDVMSVKDSVWEEILFNKVTDLEVIAERIELEIYARGES